MESNPPLDQQLRSTLEAFAEKFGRTATVAVVAPGRVNLIGEHTDYQNGFVMPLAIERQMVMAAAPREDGLVRAASTMSDEIAEFGVSADLGKGDPKWSNYVRGPVALMAAKGFETTGFDVLLDSTVPLGSGLSSSAALEVATATLVEALAGKQIDKVQKALLCQKAEHDFADTPCGIMDQFISVMGQLGHALLIDCRSHETTAVPIDPAEVAIVIANSNCPHELSGGEYAERRQQAEACAAALGVETLRDATIEQLEEKKSDLDDVIYRRGRHIIGENLRTTLAAESLQRSDWDKVGAYMFASHNSLRDDFEVSTPELDKLVELAEQKTGAGGVIGARMTGGGFGGCTVTLVKADKAEEVGAYLEAEYKKATGIDATVFVTTPADGARQLDV